MVDTIRKVGLLLYTDTGEDTSVFKCDEKLASAIEDIVRDMVEDGISPTSVDDLISTLLAMKVITATGVDMPPVIAVNASK
jgi:hypothetical protein